MQNSLNAISRPTFNALRHLIISFIINTTTTCSVFSEPQRICKHCISLKSLKCKEHYFFVFVSTFILSVQTQSWYYVCIKTTLIHKPISAITNEDVCSNMNFYNLFFEKLLVPGQTATYGSNKWVIEVIVMWLRWLWLAFITPHLSCCQTSGHR